MDRDDALFLLQLDGNLSGEAIRAAYDVKRAELTERLANAPTEGLRTKYQTALGELVEAYELLSQPSTPTSPSSALSRTQMRDLPGAAPSFTQHGSGASAAAVSLSVGEVLLNRYEVRALLGQGGMGAVYRAYDRTRAEEVALKVLLPELVSSEKAKERFLNEAKVTSRLSHPNIVRTYDIQQGEGLVFLTMELLEGETLRQRMERYKQARRQFSVEEVLEIIKPLIDALNYAHKTVIHRDLKPENIWLSSEGPVKLMDFGIARLFTQTDLTRTGMAIGSAYYMAPEQLAGEKHIDARADQYSLGVILYELLTGRLPQGAVEAPRKMRKEVAASLSDATMRSLAVQPGARFESLSTFAESFGRGRRLIALPSGNTLRNVALVVVVLILLAATGLASLRMPGEQDVLDYAAEFEPWIQQTRSELNSMAEQYAAQAPSFEQIDSLLYEAQKQSDLTNWGRSLAAYQDAVRRLERDRQAFYAHLVADFVRPQIDAMRRQLEQGGSFSLSSYGVDRNLAEAEKLAAAEKWVDAFTPFAAAHNALDLQIRNLKFEATRRTK